MSYVDTFLFGIYPYLAGAVFLIGSLIRFDREQYTVSYTHLTLPTILLV